MLPRHPDEVKHRPHGHLTKVQLVLGPTWRGSSLNAHIHVAQSSNRSFFPAYFSQNLDPWTTPNVGIKGVSRRRAIIQRWLSEQSIEP